MMKRLCRTDSQSPATKLGGAVSALAAASLLALLLLGSSTTVPLAHAQKKGGGGGTSPPPPPPPVQYRLTWLDSDWGIASLANDINNLGTVVGRATGIDGQDKAVRYSAGVLEDLNDLGAAWTNLGPGGNDGWIARTAIKINDLGEIVGWAIQTPSGIQRVFLLTFPFDDVPQFQVLAGATHVNGINDLGVVACSVNHSGDVWEQIVYTPWSEPPYQAQFLGIQGGFWGDINNAGDIVNSSGFVISPNDNGEYTPGGFLSFSNRFFYGINDPGFVAGARNSTTGKNKQSGGPIRLDLATGVEILLGSGGWGTDINEDGDVVFRGSDSRGYVYSNEHGLLALDSLVVNPDADWQAGYVEVRGLTDTDHTGFGQICGFCAAGAFILTPELPGT